MTHTPDHYEEDRAWLWRYIKRTCLLLFIVAGLTALFMVAVKAQEPYNARLTKGMLCDTKAAVVEFMDSDSNEMPEGCGLLQRPLFMRITNLGGYESDTLTATLVMYEIPSTNETVIQYGVMHITAKGEQI